MLLLKVSFEPVGLGLLLLPFLLDGQLCLPCYATLTVKFGQADLVTRINEVLQGGLHNEKPETYRQAASTKAISSLVNRESHSASKHSRSSSRFFTPKMTEPKSGIDSA